MSTTRTWPGDHAAGEFLDVDDHSVAEVGGHGFAGDLYRPVGALDGGFYFAAAGEFDADGVFLERSGHGFDGEEGHEVVVVIGAVDGLGVLILGGCGSRVEHLPFSGGQPHFVDFGIVR